MIVSNFTELHTVIHYHQKTRIGITSGCFDITHALHVHYLKQCASKCQFLIVLLDSDEMIASEKERVGSIINEMDRSFVMDNIKGVGAVMVMRSLEDLEAVMKLASAYSEDVQLFKHSNTIYGNPVIEVTGVKLTVIPDIKRMSSTTDIINHLKSQI